MKGIFCRKLADGDPKETGSDQRGEVGLLRDHRIGEFLSEMSTRIPQVSKWYYYE